MKVKIGRWMGRFQDSEITRARSTDEVMVGYGIERYDLMDVELKTKPTHE